MNDIGEWAQKVIEGAKALGLDVVEMIQEGFSVGGLFQLLYALVKTAELVVVGPGRGAEKKVIVLAVLEKLKKDHDLVRRIDDAIKLPAYLEPLDGIVINALLPVLVDGIVALLNLLGAWKNEPAG